MSIVSMGSGAVDLTGVDVFVGGPIQHAIGTDRFHPSLRHTIYDIIKDVSRAGASVFSAHVAENFGADTALFSPEHVSVRDFDWMRRCDVFVAVMPIIGDGELLRTDGTHIELGWASAMDKPIVLVTKTPIGPYASHLLRGLPLVARMSVLDIVDVQADPAGLTRHLASVTREVVVSE